VDVADPANPRFGAKLTVAPPVDAGFDVFGDYLYIAGESGGLEVFDIADANAPLQVGHTTDFVRGVVAAGGNRVVVMARDGGQLLVADVSDRTEPRIVSRLALSAGDVDLQGDFAYVSTGEGLLVVSIADPALPTIVGRQAGFAEPGAVSVSG